jgi:hypothetical protein
MEMRVGSGGRETDEASSHLRRYVPLTYLRKDQIGSSYLFRMGDVNEVRKREGTTKMEDLDVVVVVVGEEKWKEGRSNRLSIYLGKFANQGKTSGPNQQTLADQAMRIVRLICG